MINEYYIRPVQPSDFDGLFYLAEESGIGFTSLQPDPVFLEKKIQSSCESFSRPPEENTEGHYFFVCEHLPTGKLAGSCAIKNNIGTDILFYCLKVSRLSRESKDLKKKLEHRVLSLSSDYQGSTEICSLLLLPPHRKDFNGQMLSRCRYLFMANFPERFNELVIAQMRGVCDENGVSPFWEAVCRNFFDIDYPRADYLTAIGETQFISDLMPTSKLYIALLNDAARNVIGKVHPDSNNALKLLSGEGFRYRGYVDLFTGSPVMEVLRPNIKTFMDQKLVTIADTTTTPVNGPLMLITSTTLDFRALVNHVEWQTENSIILSQQVAELLHVEPGQQVRLAPLNDKK